MLGKRRESLTAQLVREITDRIDTGAYAPGAKLPTEQELINEFGVSRTVVREAISNLKASALVSTHQGIGAFVLLNPPPPAFRIEIDNMQLIEEVVRGLELRIGIELEAAALSAQRRTAADLEAMEAACVAMDKAIETGEGNIEADLEFHRAIAQSTQNSNFRQYFQLFGKSPDTPYPDSDAQAGFGHACRLPAADQCRAPSDNVGNPGQGPRRRTRRHAHAFERQP